MEGRITSRSSSYGFLLRSDALIRTPINRSRSDTSGAVVCTTGCTYYRIGVRSSLVEKSKRVRSSLVSSFFLWVRSSLLKSPLSTSQLWKTPPRVMSDKDIPPEEEWGVLPSELKEVLPQVINPAKQSDRILRFVSRAVEAHELNQLAFQARQLIQTTLPHRNPKSADIYVRKNGNASLLIQSGRDKDGKHIGIPFGSTARLLLSFITREAIRKGKRHLTLGTTLTEFCREIGLDPTHGQVMRTVREQLRRLLSCSIVFINTRELEGGGFEERLNLPVATFARLWFFTRGTNPDPNQMSVFGESEVLLNADFYDAIIKNPVPLKLGVLSALRSSPLAIDIYAWGNHRSHLATKRCVVSWWMLGEQFGHGYKNIKDFKRYFKEALEKVRVADPNIGIKSVRGGVEVTPTRTRLHITRPNTKLLDSNDGDSEGSDE